MRKPLFLSWLPVLVFVGCSKTPESVSQLRDVAVAAQKEAESDPEAAPDAALRAEKAAKKAAEIVQADPGATEDDKAASKEAGAAARAARFLAELAEEQERLQALVSGWQAKAYWAARDTALSTVFTALALAADQAAEHDMDSLPESVRAGAAGAAELAREFAKRPRLPDAETDWKAVADDLRGLSAEPPVALNQFLVVGFLCSGRHSFALRECERIDPSSLQSEVDRKWHHLLRAVLLSKNGFQHLATAEMKLVKTPTGQDGVSSMGAEELAGIHLVLAYLHLEQREYRQADLELVRAMQIWPDNPISVFLTGERLAATGEYEEAANSLEVAAQNTQFEALAEKLARRAQELRDKRGNAEPLLTDLGFLRSLAFNYFSTGAAGTQAAAKLKQAITTGEQLSDRLLKYLPGTGE